ncbi:E1 ubiquitin-activating protein aos1 [Knufia obscura]|uniref:Ubiquitin-like 1-activating enzyme E1A n=2 Tax=Knufia TaxID=430999 RepID=A0AAN8EQB3_9EURO|nr:E1 ubiquitin-activating protein aos1 [Knufia obscura]KAK5953685.1 E1 ubiquitin-activating protein aos1 [Knufia fluminis]
MDNDLEPQPAAVAANEMSNGAPTELPILPGQAQDTTMMAQPIADPTAVPVMPPMQSISADEIALYDRQIRLWGVKAQELIRNANILLIGMKALGNEIAKNLVLAGIGSLTILDHENVVEEDLGSQFLITEDDVGKNRAEAAAVELRKMNPRVDLLTDQESIMTKMPEYFAAFQIVIATGQPFEMASTINMSCRMFNVKFYAADLHGMYGYIFSDLIMHQFLLERDIQGNIPTKSGVAETSTRMVIGVEAKKANNKIKEVVTKQEMYCPLLLANSSPLPPEATKSRRAKMRVPPLLSCLRGLFEFQKQTGGRSPGASREDLALFTKVTSEKHLELQLPHETLTSAVFRSFLQNLGTEIPPTAAFLGGQVAQDVINVLGQREQPLQNLLLFDGEEFKSPIYSMQPMFDPTLSVSMAGMAADDTTQEALSNGNGVQTNGTTQAQT